MYLYLRVILGLNGTVYVKHLIPYQNNDKHRCTLMAESEEELKSLLMKLKKESEKAGLKLNIQKLFSWAPKSLQMVTAAMRLKDTYSLEGKL